MSATVESTSPLLHEEDGCVQFNKRLLYCIERHCNTEALEILKKSSGPGYARDWMGKTLLHHAAEKGNCTVLQHLIESGADVNAQDFHGEPIPLENGSPFAPPNCSYGAGDVLLEYIYSNDLKIIQLLLDHGLDANAENTYGETSLSIYGCIDAFIDENLALLRLILDRGADPTKIISKGPLKGRLQMINILRQSELESVRVLLESNIDLEAKDEEGCTAIHYLAENPSPNIFEILKDKKFDVNARNTNGCTPIHLIDTTNLSTVKFLIDRGANVNAEDKRGMTPLVRICKNFTHRYMHWNVRPLSFGNPMEKSDQIINYLLYRGADIQVCCPDEGYLFFSNIQYQWQLYWMQSILAQLAINKARGTPIETLIENKIAEHDQFERHFNMCNEQLDQMKQVKIWKSISLYEIIIASEMKFQRYMHNERLLLNLCRLKYQNKYLPYYIYVVRSRVEKAMNIAKRRKETADILCIITGLQRDHLVASQITEYLGDSDLRQMYCE